MNDKIVLKIATENYQADSNRMVYAQGMSTLIKDYTSYEYWFLSVTNIINVIRVNSHPCCVVVSCCTDWFCNINHVREYDHMNYPGNNCNSYQIIEHCLKKAT